MLTSALASRRVLLVEDDPVISDVVTRYLRREGFSVCHVTDGFSALDDISRARSDVVILDRMLPGIEGLEVCRRIRAVTDAPVLVLTALGSEDDRIAGLVAGADDYVVKPFSPRELVLRVNALVRRAVTTKTAAPDATAGDLHLDGSAHIIMKSGRPLALTSREFDLLAYLIRHPGQAFDRETLLREVWGWDIGDATTITVHVRRLREKIEPEPSAPRVLRTVWGVGYMLAEAA